MSPNRDYITRRKRRSEKNTDEPSRRFETIDGREYRYPQKTRSFLHPPISKDEAERRGLVRFLNTAAAVPCLYNVDSLNAQPDKVLICEGESDTWAALSYGYAAVGTPGARNFKAAWVEGFRGLQDTAGRSRVYLLLDADKAGGEGSLVIADLFLKAGLPVPLRMILPAGMDLTDFMREGMTE